MTDNILFNIFVLSLMCSGIALLIIVIRKLFGKKSGAWWRSIIWLIMLIRLCVPVLIQSPIGVMNNFTFTDSVYEARESEDSFAAARQTQTAVSPVRQLAVNKNESDYALTENDIPTRGKIDWLRMANYLYAAGFVISAGLLSARIFVLNKRISKLKICRDKNILSVFHQIKKQMGIKRKISLLIETDDDAPALSGMLFPNVIIPESAMNITNVSELEYIFIHELTHYKRCDVAKLWLLELTICIHWFNPILHLLKRTIVQDFELACDERVLSSISNSEYAKYGNVLVNFSTRKKSKNPVVVTTNFVGRNGKNLRERLVMIKMFNKKKIIRLLN